MVTDNPELLKEEEFSRVANAVKTLESIIQSEESFDGQIVASNSLFTITRIRE